jgi:choline dehydrogenase
MWSKTYNWCFETDPDPGMNGRRIYWPRGKTLGGSSSINGLIYIRGQREDYDHWAALGNPAGASTRCCPTSSAASTTSAAPAPGTAPRRLARVGHRGQARADRSLHRRRRQRGVPRNDDFNGATQEGAGYYQLTTHRAGAAAPPRPT